jgi:outer membrane protein insertion porin family
VQIKERIEELPNNEISLIYEIAEGEKLYIRKIEFVGNTQFDDDDLKDIMETSEKGFFSWFTDSGLLDEKKLEFDAQKIISFYHNKGYIKAKAGEPKISYEKEKGLNITIEIIEGHQYMVNEVNVAGDLVKPADELLKNVNIKKEKFFNREVVRRDSLVLRGTYTDEGYAYVEVSPMIKEDDEKNLVDITYTISKGERVRFERINITGNTITRDKVIRRELRVIEGEYFSGKALRKSTANLHRLGFFEDVEVQTKKGSEEDLMVLNVNVKERPTGSFSIGAGYSSFENAIVIFQIAQNNLFGFGQRLGASVSIGGRTQNFDIRFTEPWLFDRPLSGGFDLYNWEREFDEYTQDSLGGALRFGFRLGFDEFIRVSARYAYDDADISDVAATASTAIKDTEGQNVTSSISLGISRDSRDRPFYTSKGSINSFNFETAGGFLGGDVGFNKVVARTAWYFPLFWKTVFVTQGRWGWIDQKSDEKLPVYHKFRTGGINTVRGFEFASISPRDPLTGDRIGGEQMMIYNVEYRFPLIKEQGVVGLVFFDAGNVFTDDPTAVTISGLRTSAGGGIRWYSPVGPLRIEYGKNLNQKPGESSGEWEFTMGGTF